MAEEHFFPAGDFCSGLGAVPFFAPAPYAPPPPPGLDVAAMAPFGMLPWASTELPLPSDSVATTATAHFDSALSSLVSSPAHAAGDDVAALGDLIGRLGSICSKAAAGSANNSCYSTPLSSPPRGASPAALAAFRLSGCYHLETGGGGRLSRVASSKSLGASNAAAAPAFESAVAEALETSPTTAATGGNKAETPADNGSGAAARKRKASGKGKAATNTSPTKRSKLVAGDGDENNTAAGDEAAAEEEEEEKKAEPVKDYIHVRARRGQATDSHSLAERVRREKISERMKLLQSLVPGCNKGQITGKALMLDEIINYVQSLQRQVEFLSMKLSTMNPQLDVDAPQFLPSDDKDMMMHQQTAMLGYPHQDATTGAFSYADPFTAGAMHNHPTMESCASGSFHTGAGAFGGWDAAAQDLQSIVHRHDMAPVSSSHDQLPSHPAGHGFRGGQEEEEAVTVSHMKVEP